MGAEKDNERELMIHGLGAKGIEEFDKAVKAWARKEGLDFHTKEQVNAIKARRKGFTPANPLVYGKVTEEQLTKILKDLTTVVPKPQEREFVVFRHCLERGLFKDNFREPLCDIPECVSCREIEQANITYSKIEADFWFNKKTNKREDKAEKAKPKGSKFF